jgi:hypothetical protein
MGAPILITGHPTAVAARRSSISDLWHLIDGNGDTVDVVHGRILPEYLTVGQHADLLADEAGTTSRLLDNPHYAERWTR